MLNLKSVVFKVAVLPPQSRQFAPSGSRCAIQKNQQLIPKPKHRETQPELFRQQNCWRLSPLCGHANTHAGTALPTRTHCDPRRDRIPGGELPANGMREQSRHDALDLGLCAVGLHKRFSSDHAILVLKMTIKTKSMMRRRVNRARPSGLV
jgi:hypothetical protein